MIPLPPAGPGTRQSHRVAIAVHGGAYAIAEPDREANRRGCEVALQAGLAVLEEGGSAVDAVEAAVLVLEDDETFDAGYGSHVTAAGGIEMDAALMDGATGRIGSVACLTSIRNPIRVAKLVMGSDLSMLVGDGALEYAARHGIPLCSTEELISPRERVRWATQAFAVRDDDSADRYFGDTVGAVALDQAGNLAAATSTGGTPSKLPGRVGDSPIIGAGLYADRGAAVSCTGHGERITQVVWAKHVADLVGPCASKAEAAREAIDALRAARGVGGFILLDAEGRGVVRWSTGAMAFALKERESDRILSGPAELESGNDAAAAQCVSAGSEADLSSSDATAER